MKVFSNLKSNSVASEVWIKNVEDFQFPLCCVVEQRKSPLADSVRYGNADLRQLNYDDKSAVTITNTTTPPINVLSTNLQVMCRFIEIKLS